MGGAPIWMDNALLYVTELTDHLVYSSQIHGIDRHRWRTPQLTRSYRCSPLPRIDFTVPLSWVRQTPAKPRPTRLHLPRRTLAPPAPPCESPYHRWELSIVPPRLIIYSNRVGLEPNLPLTRLLTHNPRLSALFPFFTQHL